MLVMIIGVFILPIFGIGFKYVKLFFGLAVLLFLGYPFALAGHYEMYKKGHRSYSFCPFQERLVIVLICSAIIAYIILFFKVKD